MNLFYDAVAPVHGPRLAQQHPFQENTMSVVSSRR